MYADGYTYWLAYHRQPLQIPAATSGGVMIGERTSIEIIGDETFLLHSISTYAEGEITAGHEWTKAF